MSDTAPVPGSRLTVEDAGSTTDAADLGQGDGTVSGTTGTAPVAGGAHAVTPGASGTSATDSAATPSNRSDSTTSSDADDLPSAPGATTSGLSSLIADDDGSIGHVFDQTNGVIDGLDGDSDGTAESDELSAADRADQNPPLDAYDETEAPRAADADDPRITGN
ncbi:hypothetical protein [Amnibacterium kyonggiense]